MNSFWKCFWYLITIGIIAFFAGRIAPKKWFVPDKFPYRAYKFEKDGRLYDIFKVRKWQNKLPDMSKILPQIMPAKNMSGNYKERLPLLLQETCIAELVHLLLSISGLLCLKFYPGIGGIIIVLLYIVIFNLPFIIIQRYNRLRFIKIMQKIERDEITEKLENIDAAYEC